VARSVIGEPALSVLAALVAGPTHGYAVITEIEQLTGRRLGPGTLYGIIARLERQGLIVALERGERGRTPYRVTAAGKRAFEQELDALAAQRRALVALSQR
jgi:DNA-binding PadR family transcriptional regulator